MCIEAVVWSLATIVLPRLRFGGRSFEANPRFAQGKSVLIQTKQISNLREHVARKLKPQNWSDFRKNLQLFIITLAAIVPDFDSGIGIADIFALAVQFEPPTYELTHCLVYVSAIDCGEFSWSIFLLGWGGLFAVMLMRTIGRLSCTFLVLSLGFSGGCTFAPNLKTFTAMRCLTAFFGTCPQVTGLYIVTDLFPFHLQARKLNIWTMGFIISPFLSPFAFGFLVARANWRWTYGIGSIYGAVVVCFIAFFAEETMFDRKLPNPRPIPRPYLVFATGSKHLLE
ncbi:hypothetical protein A0H81_02271 [Grifola frondosa]|uniref:Major facilitator superfamily (MFS) profile domain-containing protein n=1 Tax=Grifola frondosa TaxID=5627 RepID=A0A1C7ML87_GRIFR|nr:hypothetical protein A0H81_02271 [Grifola frondosa]